MTASEIAESLINGNISDAREAIVGAPGGIADSCVLALDVLAELMHETPEADNFVGEALTRLRRCLTGGT